MKSSRKLILVIILFSTVQAASAIDLNSSTSLRYFPDSSQEFGVDTEGNTDINGELNITDSGTTVADFSQNQIKMHQPLSIESSGALSVANGIDLTDSSSNTIDSYSTFYLQTSSGSASDIVLQPTGVTDIDSNVTVRGNIDLDNNEIRGLSDPTDPQDAATRSYVNNNDDTIQDNQGLEEVLSIDNNVGGENINFNETSNIQSDGTNAITLDNNQNIGIPNGDLKIGEADTNTGGSETRSLVVAGGENGESSIDFSDDNIVRDQIVQKNGISGMPLRFKNDDGDTRFEISTGKTDFPTGDVKISNGNLMLTSSAGKIIKNGGGGDYTAIQFKDDGTTVHTIEPNYGTNGRPLAIRGGDVEVPNGNLGVGLSSPGTPIDIAGSIDASSEDYWSNAAIRVNNFKESNGQGTAIAIEDEAGGGAGGRGGLIVEGSAPAAGGDQLHFSSDIDASSPKMVTVSRSDGGLLGINDTRPSHTLELRGEARFADSDNEDVLMLNDGNNNNVEIPNGELYVTGNDVGVGTTSPGAWLHIKEDVNSGRNQMVHLQRENSVDSVDEMLLIDNNDGSGADKVDNGITIETVAGDSDDGLHTGLDVSDSNIHDYSIQIGSNPITGNPIKLSDADVEITNGNLEMNGNNIRDIGTSNVDIVHDSSDDRVEMRSNGKEDICIGNCET